MLSIQREDYIMINVVNMRMMMGEGLSKRHNQEKTNSDEGMEATTIAKAMEETSAAGNGTQQQPKTNSSLRSNIQSQCLAKGLC